MESIWNLCGIYVESIWNLCGIYVESLTGIGTVKISSYSIVFLNPPPVSILILCDNETFIFILAIQRCAWTIMLINEWSKAFQIGISADLCEELHQMIFFEVN